MRKRLTNIHKAPERVDARITDLLIAAFRLGVSPRFAAAGTTNQEHKTSAPGMIAGRAW
jgi:hypothetical protein